MPELVKRPKNIVIKVRHTPDQEYGYVAKWGSYYEAQGRSLAESLHLLANHLDAKGEFGSAEAAFENITLPAAIDCKYCNGKIFFAKLPPPSGKFLAFDVESIDASLVPFERVAVFSKTVDNMNRPNVLWVHKAGGPVWVPHPRTCGVQNDPPENLALRGRWMQFRGDAIEEYDDLVTGLREMRREMQEMAV